MVPQKSEEGEWADKCEEGRRAAEDIRACLKNLEAGNMDLNKCYMWVFVSSFHVRHELGLKSTLI